MTGSSLPPTAGARTILVVEDQHALRVLMGQMLSLAGHRPLLAADLADALAYIRVERTIDLLITDVIMPGTSGIGVASRLREIRPELPVLFVSGYPGVGAIAEAMDFLPKPFTRDELLHAVRATFENQRRRASERAGDGEIRTACADFIL